MSGKQWVMYVVVHSVHGFLTDDDSYNHDIGHAKLFYTQDFAEASVCYCDECVMKVKITLEEVSQ